MANEPLQYGGEERIPRDGPAPSKSNTEPLPESFGRNLDTIAKARQWLCNPHNWHHSNLFILKWNGLLCTVDRRHGERVWRETWDDGLPWAVCYEQKRRRIRDSGPEEGAEQAPADEEG